MTKHAKAAAAMGSGVGMNAISSMLAGMILWGGLGYLADKWLHTPFLVAIGVLVGLALGVYLVYLRFGRPESATQTEQHRDPDEVATTASSRGRASTGEEHL